MSKRVSVLTVLLLWLQSANAVVVNFDGAAVPTGCSLSSAAKTYTCSSIPTTSADDLVIAADYVVTANANVVANTALIAAGGGLIANITTSATMAMKPSAYVKGNLSVGTTLILEEQGYVTGNLTAGSSIALLAGAHVGGNVTSDTSSVALGTGAYVNGTINAPLSTVALGANAFVDGSVLAGTSLSLADSAHVGVNVISSNSTISLDVNAYVLGNVKAFTTVTLGAGAYVNGTVEAGTSAALGAGAYVKKNLQTGTTAFLGAGAYVENSLIAGTTAQLGAGAFVCGNMTAPNTLDLGAGAFVASNMTSDTVTMTAGSYVNGHLKASTATLLTETCYGSIDVITLTDAGRGVCTLPRPVTICTSVPPADNTAASNFECLETGTNAAWSATTRKPLYTKLASTSFTLDIAALKVDGTLENNYVASGGAARSVTVELVDGAGSTACASRTAISPAVAQTLSFAATDAGRKTSASMTVSKAYANLRCRVTDASQPTQVVGCSSDNFAVRPLGFAVSSPNANADGTGLSTAAAPAIKAGALFSLTADTATAGYNGTPVLDASKVAAHAGAIQSGTLTGTFGAATAATGNNATGAGFAYGEVGYFRLATEGVVDTSFTGVDSAASDCVVGSSSNTASGGKYGCNIGSVTSPYFGRFTPDHFVVAPGTVVNRQAAACSVASTFSYAGEKFLLKDFKLTATNGLALPTTTQNYTSLFARFDASALSNFGFAAVDLANAIAPLDATAFVNGSGAGQFGLVSSSGSWASGVGTFSTNVQLNRAAAPNGPFESLRMGIDPLDADLVGVLPADKNLDISAPADGINDKVLLASTKVRYGRIRMQNAYGSELLSLPLPLEVQYWAGSYYVTNTQDSCTNISVSTLTMGNYTKSLNACETQLTPTSSMTMVAGKLPAPGIVLTKPGAGNAGSVDLAINLGGVAGNTCVGAGQTPVSPANMPWFGTTNTTVRATFGVYKSPLIYRRENY